MFLILYYFTYLSYIPYVYGLWIPIYFIRTEICKYAFITYHYYIIKYFCLSSSRLCAQWSPAQPESPLPKTKEHPGTCQEEESGLADSNTFPLPRLTKDPDETPNPSLRVGRLETETGLLAAIPPWRSCAHGVSSRAEGCDLRCNGWWLGFTSLWRSPRVSRSSRERIKGSSLPRELAAEATPVGPCTETET